MLSKAPVKADVFKSLDELYTTDNLLIERLKKVEADPHFDKYVIFSDQHKGNKSYADDFANNEVNYLAALDYYNHNNYNFVNLGDSEELWKFGVLDIMRQNEAAFKAEAAFYPGRYYKTFGNHDVIWKNPVDVALHLTKFFGITLPVYEGLLITVKKLSKPLHIFLTHGHQGDMMSDKNAISTWIIAHLWMPLQRYLRLNINVPSKDYTLRNAHNKLMYEWSSCKPNLILVTGHTHKPVFASGKYLDHPANRIDTVDTNEQLRPSYFNTGCCCYADGDITGIEIADNSIRLIKWHFEDGVSSRIVLEETGLETLLNDLECQ